MKLFRWWLSKKLNALAWAIAPEPHRSNMMRAWDVVGPDWIKECAKLKETTP